MFTALNYHLRGIIFSVVSPKFVITDETTSRLLNDLFELGLFVAE